MIMYWSVYHAWWIKVMHILHTGGLYRAVKKTMLFRNKNIIKKLTPKVFNYVKLFSLLLFLTLNRPRWGRICRGALYQVEDTTNQSSTIGTLKSAYKVQWFNWVSMNVNDGPGGSTEPWYRTTITTKIFQKCLDGLNNVKYRKKKKSLKNF